MDFNSSKEYLKIDDTHYPEIRVALLCDFAQQFLSIALRAMAKKNGFQIHLFVGDYNQTGLLLSNSNSELFLFKPDYIIWALSPYKHRLDFYKTEKQHEYSNILINSIKDYYNIIKSNGTPKLIITNLPELDDSVFGNFSNKINYSYLSQCREFNDDLSSLSIELNDMFICDVKNIANRIGYDNAFEPKLYINSDIVYSLDFHPLIAKNCFDIISAISGKITKCIILDLDNTLWGGIIGDDGLENIQIGNLGIGKAFTEIQLWLKQLKQRGIILAVCTKNDERLAKEVFEKHPDMILKFDDIAIFAANWESKVDNIKLIQSELNIGFDSMVFLDDSKYERESVKAELPDIIVPDLPEDPALYLSSLQSLNLFETNSLTSTDINRGEQYRQQQNRKEFAKSFTSHEDYLKSLGMKSNVAAINKMTLPRAAQLFQRSNQFNLRTIRYSESELDYIINSDEYFTLTFTLEDKFGDNGLIAVVILKKDGNKSLFIENWAMSCRILKRGMEEFVMNEIVELALKEGFDNIIGEYLQTSKNMMVENLFANFCFEKKEGICFLNFKDYKINKTFIGKTEDKK